MFKYVCCNKEGYVNLKFIMLFKKVKMLIKDYRVVVEVLEKLKVFLLNLEKIKVRRNVFFFLEFFECNLGRIVVVIRLENVIMEGVSEIFFKCGEIELICIIWLGKLIFVDLKFYFVKYLEFEKEIIVVVVFEMMVVVVCVCSELLKEGGMKVVEFGKYGVKKEKLKFKMKFKERGSDGGWDLDEEYDDFKKKCWNRKKDKCV